MENMTDAGSKRFVCTNYDILVVEPDEEVRDKVLRQLFGYGISTDSAASAAEAAALSAKHHYDMILADEKLPDKADVEQIDGTAALISLDENTVFTVLDKAISEEKKQYIAAKEIESGQADTLMASLFMPGVDVLGAVRLNGGVDDYIDLLDLFYTDGQTRVDSLAEKIENGDFTNYTIEVHGLKSSALNVGANALSAKAKQHEMWGNASEFDNIEKNKEELFADYRVILGEIKRVLKGIGYGQFAGAENKDLTPISKEETTEKLKQILEHLEDFRSKEAAAGVEELLTFAVTEPVREALDKIQTMLRVYEDDEAEEALRSLIEKG